MTRSETYRGERKAAAASVTYLIDYDEAYDTDPVTALSSGEVDIAALTAVQAQAAEEAGCGVLAVDDAVTGLLLNPQSDKLETPSSVPCSSRPWTGRTCSPAGKAQWRPRALWRTACCGTAAYYSQGTQAYTPQDLEAPKSFPLCCAA